MSMTARDWLAARRPLWAVYPTRRLAVVVLLLSVLWLVPGSAGVVAAGIGLALATIAVGVDYIPLPGRRDVDISRDIPPTLGLGDTLDAHIVIESHWRRPVHATLSHELPATFEVAPAARVEIGAGATVAVPLPFTPMRRGTVDLGAVALRVTTDLGLLARIIRAPLDGRAVVVPSLANVRRFRLMALQHRLRDVGIRALRRRGEGRSFAGMREYVPGDDPRNIDWKATARHGRVMAREFTIERSQTVIALVDCGRAMTQMAGEFARIEHVLSAAILLTDVATVSGDQVGALAFDEIVRAYVPAQRGRAAVGAVREALSGVGASMAEPDYAAAFRMLALRQRRRALIVFFTDVIDARASRTLTAYLGRAASRHVVVVVAIRNDELLAATRPAATTPLAVYASAAAEELVQERDEALVRMRRAGVTVLDVSAAHMATAVVNRYLEIKARGLL
jgi:uncharacterized protein (DUF58 family)